MSTYFEQCERYFASWSSVKITDIPRGSPSESGMAGAYQLIEGDSQTFTQRGAAQGWTRAKLGLPIRTDWTRVPLYWIKLGRMMRATLNRGLCYGRCFSCAALVVYDLLMDPSFDNDTIVLAGNEEFDHYFIVINNLSIDPHFWPSAYVVDIWDMNLNIQTKRTEPENYRPVCKYSEFRYAQRGHVTQFCAIEPQNRIKLRADVNSEF